PLPPPPSGCLRKTPQIEAGRVLIGTKRELCQENGGVIHRALCLITIVRKDGAPLICHAGAWYLWGWRTPMPMLPLQAPLGYGLTHWRIGKFAGIAALAAVLAAGLPRAGQAQKPGEGFQTAAPHAILIDSDSGSVLFEKAADQLTFPASLSKLMTVEVVFHEI